MKKYCQKCHGAGWLWAHELDDYESDSHDCYSDDTRYTCDLCNGKRIINPIPKIIRELEKKLDDATKTD